MSQLKVEGLTKHFGGITAVMDVDLTVAPGERHAIIGPNGAGKSTFFNLVAGELRPSSGRVFLDGRDVSFLPVHARARMGVGHTFQRNNLFFGLTALQNVKLAIQRRLGIAGRLYKPLDRYEEVHDQAQAILERVGLAAQRSRRVEALAYGQQRALEIAVALAVEPSLILLDEPTAGMSPAETVEMTRLIETLPDSLTMLIVEHDMDVIFSLAERITVLHFGQVISQGTPAEVRADAQVRQIYLGLD